MQKGKHDIQLQKHWKMGRQS